MPLKLILIIVGAVVLIGLLLIPIILQYKKISKLKSAVKESYSTLIVFLEKRLEIVSTILSLCSQKSMQNREIGNLVSISMQLKQNLDTHRRFSLESNLDNAIKTAMSTLQILNSENAKYQQTLQNLSEIQADVISTKNYYNNNVEAYNKKLIYAPSSWVARVFGFKKEYYLK